MTSEKRHMDFNIKFHNISNEEIISKEKKQALHLGWINRYEYTRGYGFISDLYDNKSYFFHITSLGKEFFSSEYTNNSEEVKEHLVVVEGVFHIYQVHLELMLGDLFLADLEGFLFLPEIFLQLGQILFRGTADDGL